VTLTPTRTATATAVPPTASVTPTTGAGACSPVTASITAPFTFDGAGAFCWQIATIPSYANNWNLASLTINGVNFTGVYVAAANLPAKINGFYYISYTGNFAWSHFELK
jgi:endoglucanase